VNDKNECLAELLASAGFRTIAVVGSFALESLFGLDQGFERYDEEFSLEFSPQLYDQNQRRADEVTQRALELVDACLDGDAEARIFLFAHYFDPHAPYDPPDWALRRVGLEPGARADLRDVGAAVADQQEAAAGVRPGQRWAFTNGLTEALLDGAVGAPLDRGERLALLYAAEVAFMDREIGHLVDGLAERGILQDSVLILVGDHGETFWEHGDFWNHGLGVYQSTVLVPLLMRLPGGEGAGQRVDEPATSLDIVPTVCALVGVDVPAEVEGVDLSGSWRGRSLGDRFLVSEATQPVGGGVESEGRWWNSLKAKSARRGRWKYIRTPYLGDREELYDLVADPAERVNLLRSPSVEALERKAALRGQLEEWERRTQPLPSAFDSTQADLVRSRLGALGYVGEDG
jgi:arylsulfatase A-like enzyme